MKLFVSAFSLALFFAACGTNPNPNGNRYSNIRVDELTENDMFTYVKVKSYLEQQQSKADKDHSFLKGIDAFKNKKDLDSAEYYLTSSILLSPTSLAYYELGNVSMDQKNYKKAIYAYEMAERLGYEPFSKVLYNIACAHSLEGDAELAGQYLEYAIQAGYSNIDNINEDEDLAYLRENRYLFNTHLNQGLKGLSNAENLFWLQFKRKFNKTPFPLKLDENLDLLLLNDETRISYDFEKYIAEMRDEKFSREVSKGFYYLADIKETSGYTVLVYVIKEEFYGDEAPLTFRLATFTNEGKLIDKKEIAGRSDFSKPLKSAVIKSDMSIVITSYETEFEKDPEEEGYHDNAVSKKTKIGEESYTIDSKGKIVRTAPPALSSK